VLSLLPGSNGPSNDVPIGAAQPNQACLEGIKSGPPSQAWSEPGLRSPLWQGIGLVERAAALLLSAFSLPILACGAAAVAVLSRQAPFIAHRRVGLSGRVLWVWKLRTMWTPAQHGALRPFFVEFLTDAPVPLNKAVPDPRVTSGVALFLRKYSIDELPQLFQVVLGQLALVGPRPLTEAEISRYYGAMRKTLLVVKPGVTGLWQVNGRNRLSYEQRKSLDQYLLSNWSVRLYLKILFSTVFCVVTGKDAH
jgi:lipopolysaccharide/colanic/teichoic acid biosynthesis glycosyltransferase